MMLQLMQGNNIVGVIDLQPLSLFYTCINNVGARVPVHNVLYYEPLNVTAYHVHLTHGIPLVGLKIREMFRQYRHHGRQIDARIPSFNRKAMSGSMDLVQEIFSFHPELTT